MSKKIIGVTVGTPINPSYLKDKLNPVTSVNGVTADENGNVEITISDSGGNVDQPTEYFLLKSPSGTVYKVTISDDGTLQTKNTDVQTIPVNGISLVDRVVVPANGTVAIIPVISPEDATNKKVTWISSDTTIATVSDGVVTWVGYGNCTIVAETEDGGYSASCDVSCEAEADSILSYSKYLGTTTYTPGTYTAWCPTGLIYDETRDVYAHFMNVQNTHYTANNACELWFNTINPETMEHSEPMYIARTAESTSGTFASKGALGCCVKNGVYYMFSVAGRGYYKSEDGGESWTHNEYETGPDQNPWGCYVLDNGRMIMGCDTSAHKIYFSDDDGQNWSTVQSANFNEPTFIDFGKGTVMAICRENMDSDKNIQPPWMHVSYDYGATWTDAVAMETVGYMGNNNCNAYTHDGIVELFVGCRIPTESPQYTDTLYQINHYTMDLARGATDDFTFVGTVYQFKNDDNPQGITASFTGADDFSTPCVAVRDKGHALMMFYAPGSRVVTHHFIAIANVPVDDFEIPKPLPTSFKASQVFTGDGTPITVCPTNATTFNGKYPTLTTDTYLILDDIEDGGYFHIKVQAPSVSSYYDTPVLTNVKDLNVFAGNVDVALPATPMPSGATKLKTFRATAHIYPSIDVDIYARFKENAWWMFLRDDTWIRNYTSDSGIPIAKGATLSGVHKDSGYLIPYVIGGLTTYKTYAHSRFLDGKQIYAIEYDKASAE